MLDRIASKLSSANTVTHASFNELLVSTQTTAFLIIKDGQLIYENYFNGYKRDSINTSFSVAKSFISALVGIAIDEGLINSVDDSITKYIPELKYKDSRYSAIAIKNLLSMASGLRYSKKRHLLAMMQKPITILTCAQ